MVSLLVFFGLLGYAAYNVWWFGIHGAAAVVFALLIPYGAWLDLRFRARRRKLHPDNNFHNLPRLNARGFGKHGEPLL